MPTTAGTGSEVTPWATIWDRAAGKKYSLHLPQTWPEAALVDPGADPVAARRGRRLPPGLDACRMRSNRSGTSTPIPSRTPTRSAAARAVLATLPTLIDDLGDPELRRRMSLAALHAGLAFSNTKTALAHSISYDMTLRHGLPHGIACSFTLPLVLARALGADAGRDAVLARIFDGALADAPAALAAFLEALGVSTRFASYGVSDSRSRPHDRSGARRRAGQELHRGGRPVPSPLAVETCRHERPRHPPRIDAHRRRSGRSGPQSSRSAIRSPNRSSAPCPRPPSTTCVARSRSRAATGRR